MTMIRRTFLSLLILVALLIGIGVGLAQDDEPTVVHISWATQYQEIDGFGLSGAFRQAENLMAYTESQRTEILDLLFLQAFTLWQKQQKC